MTCLELHEKQKNLKEVSLGIEKAVASLTEKELGIVREKLLEFLATSRFLKDMGNIVENIKL